MSYRATKLIALGFTIGCACQAQHIWQPGAFNPTKADWIGFDWLWAALAVNLLFGLSRIADYILRGAKGANVSAGKAIIFVGLWILDFKLRNSLAPQWLQRLPQFEGFASFFSTGLLLCSVGFACVPRTNKLARIADGREIPTRSVTAITYSVLVIGLLLFVIGSFGSVALFLASPAAGPAEVLRNQSWRTLIPQVVGLYLVAVFVGLRRLENWGRIIFLPVGAATIPVSWYALWVLFLSDARHLFEAGTLRGKAASAGPS
jgi:hypothetical protein